MGVDIVIVSFNTRDLLRACLASVMTAAEEVADVRAIVVDNASGDGSPDMVLGEFPSATLIALDENIGFGPANNRGVRAGNGAYLLFLNSDAELGAGALRALVAFLDDHPTCVAVGPRLEYPDGRFQLSCRRFPNLIRGFWNTAGLQRRFPRFRAMQTWLAEDEHTPGAKVDMVSGACFLIRRDYLDAIGGFDEHLFLYEEEMDVMLPARRRGLDVCFCPEARVIHHHGASSGERQASDTSLFHLYRSKYYTFRKHYGGAVAWLAFASDYAVFALSAMINRLRGTSAPATRNATFCARGYRASRTRGGR
ncbi:MAG: glycosyltransferase family 2 protein [Candidatus Hydrogenedentes bacterium]|nr:glycosyltransferase family 2 protein [Candidatus Hydrogenedentota bacterium]